MSTRTICPACNGGRTSEKSCVVYERSGVEFYRCFRASCPRPYGIWNGGALTDKPKVEHDWPHLKPMPPERMRWLASKFLLSNADLARLRALWTGDRYWYPIRDARLAEQGGIARSYWKTPKALTFVHEWGTGAWYQGPPSPSIWVVEDQVSACKMAEYHTTCALLGVSLAAACRYALVASGKRIVVALDGDALYQSTKISDQLQRAGCETQVVFLDKDIKNMEHWEVECLSKK